MTTSLEMPQSSEALFAVLSQASQQAVDSEQVDEIMSRVAQNTLKAAGAGTVGLAKSDELKAWSALAIASDVKQCYPQLFGVE